MITIERKNFVELDEATRDRIITTAKSIAEIEGARAQLRPIREGDYRTPGEMYTDFREANAAAGQGETLRQQAAARLGIVLQA